MHGRMADGSLAPIDFEISQDPEFHIGGGGLYSAGRDYLAFCRMILSGKQVLKPETVGLMCKNHVGDLLVTKLVSVATQATNAFETAVYAQVQQRTA
jgi:hypothetical protein